MRWNCLLAGVSAVAALGLAAVQPAQADGYRAAKGSREYRPAYYPAYYPVQRRPVVSAYFITDPYAYRYEPRGYYPYYDSGYWRPICGSNINSVPQAYQPPYWKAWGYPKPWSNRAFHRVYHGRIRAWHW